MKNPNPSSTDKDAGSEKVIFVRIAQGLFIILGIVWILFSVISLIRFPDSSTTIVACLMIGNAGMLLLIGWGLGKRERRIYTMAFVVLAVNVLLTLADDIGLFDYILFALYMITAVVLLGTRSLYRKFDPDGPPR